MSKTKRRQKHRPQKTKSNVETSTLPSENDAVDWRNRLKPFLGAIGSGALLVLIFPNASISFLAYVALVPLFWVIEGVSLKRSFLYGFLAGFSGYLGILYWLIGTMYIFGHLSVAQSVFLYVLLVFGYIAPLIGLGVVLIQVLYRRYRFPFSLAAPIAWVAFEHMRSWLLTGFPWAALGYSQIENLTLVQFADLFGVYGVSAWIVFVNAVLYGFFKTGMNRRKQKAFLPWPKREGAIVLTLFVLIFIYGNIQNKKLTKAIEAQKTAGQNIRVGLIQGNIRQDEKWDDRNRQRTFDIYERLSKQTVKEGAELIIWPETAMPVFHLKDSPMDRKVTQIVKRIGCMVLTGCPSKRVEYVNQEKRVKKLNAAYLLAPDLPDKDAILDEYNKIHLVPFGEYLPGWIEKLLPFARKLTEFAGDFTGGEENKTLTFKDHPFGVMICYEAIFPDLIRRFIKAGGKFLVNITNDAWFGDTSAPYQHLDMVAMRAVENKVFIVRAANTGVTAVIEPNGHIRKATALFETAYLVDDMVPLTQKTLYTYIGDLLAWIFLAITILVPSGTAISHRIRHRNVAKK